MGDVTLNYIALTLGLIEQIQLIINSITDIILKEDI